MMTVIIMRTAAKSKMEMFALWTYDRGIILHGNCFFLYKLIMDIGII